MIMSIGTLFDHWFTVALGLGSTVVLLLIIAAFFGVLPIITSALTPIVSSIGHFIKYYMEDFTDGFQYIVENGHAILFVATLVVGMHIADKYYFVPKNDCAAMLQDLHSKFNFVPKPKKKGWLG